MKASDKPEISKKWWTSEKPDEIKGQELEKALANAEKALADADKKGDAESIDACLVALESLGSCAGKTIKKECDKKKHKEVIAVLEKYEDLIAEESQRLEEAKAALAQSADGEQEDEEEKGVLKEEYLARMIKKLRSGDQLNFCFGLDKSTPEDSRLVLCNKRDPERLKKILKGTGEFSNRLMTFGNASADGKVLQFKLAEDAKEPSQIVKLAKAFLKGNRELKFKKLRVLVGDQTFEEDMDAEGMPSNDLGQELARVQALVAAWKATLQDVAGQIDALRKSIDGQNEPALQPVSKGLGTVMDQFPDLDLSKLAAAAQANDRAAYDQTLTQTAREIRQMHDLLTKGPLLSTIDENPFVNTNVHATVNSTLERISSELGMSA